MHARKVCKDFEVKNVDEYNNLYVKNDNLLLANVYENFRKNVFKYLLSTSCKILFNSRISMVSSF